MQRLGLEVPQPPDPSILDIRPDGVSLRWDPPEHKASVIKYAIQVNGILVGEIAPHETSISLTGLPPGKGYTIRVVATNSSHFQASSEAIRVQTLVDDDHSAEVNITSSTSRGHDGYPAPTVMPYKGCHEALLSPGTAPAMAREHSGSLPSSKRGPAVRRPSPGAATDLDAKEHSQHDYEVHGTVKELNLKLNQAREEIDEVERQVKEEQQEFEAERDALVDRREELRNKLRDREGESKDLKGCDESRETEYCCPEQEATARKSAA